MDEVPSPNKAFTSFVSYRDIFYHIFFLYVVGIMCSPIVKVENLGFSAWFSPPTGAATPDPEYFGTWLSNGQCTHRRSRTPSFCRCIGTSCTVAQAYRDIRCRLETRCKACILKKLCTHHRQHILLLHLRKHHLPSLRMLLCRQQ